MLISVVFVQTTYLLHYESVS